MLKDIVNNTKSSSFKDGFNEAAYRAWRTNYCRTFQKFRVSIPYPTKTLNELIEIGLVQETGKRAHY